MQGPLPAWQCAATQLEYAASLAAEDPGAPELAACALQLATCLASQRPGQQREQASRVLGSLLGSIALRESAEV